MIKRVFHIIAILTLTASATAQVEQPRNILEIGIAGGLNMSQMDMQPKIGQKYLNGLNGGLSIRYTSEKYFNMICAAQLEVNFSQRGWEEDFDDQTGNSQLHRDTLLCPFGIWQRATWSTVLYQSWPTGRFSFRRRRGVYRQLGYRESPRKHTTRLWQERR